MESPQVPPISSVPNIVKKTNTRYYNIQKKGILVKRARLQTQVFYSSTEETKSKATSDTELINSFGLIGVTCPGTARWHYFFLFFSFQEIVAFFVLARWVCSSSWYEERTPAGLSLPFQFGTPAGVSRGFQINHNPGGDLVYVIIIRQCYKDYPGMGNRSIFYPYSSVGNTFTSDVVQVTGSNLTSNVYFIETLARASLKPHIPGSPSNETKRVGQRADVYGFDAPKHPAVQRGAECYKDYPGLGNRSAFYSIAQ